MLVILRVNPMRGEDCIIGLKERIGRDSVLFWETVQVLLGGHDNLVDDANV